jgi:protein-disulfide isomerase
MFAVGATESGRMGAGKLVAKGLERSRQMVKNQKKLIALIALALSGLIGISSTSLGARPAPPQAKPSLADIAAGKSLGTKGAPITIEDFSDFQCPMCRSVFLGITRQLIDDYVNTGKVYLVHHDFPWTMHAHSREAAKWANAAAVIGKFQEVETALYTKQDSWAATGNLEEVVAGVLTPAEMKRVKLLYASPEIDAAIQHDLDLGHSRSVNETPTIFVTHKGQTVPVAAAGASLPLMKQYIEYLLKQ